MKPYMLMNAVSMVIAILWMIVMFAIVSTHSTIDAFITLLFGISMLILGFSIARIGHRK